MRVWSHAIASTAEAPVPRLASWAQACCRRRDLHSSRARRQFGDAVDNILGLAIGSGINSNDSHVRKERDRRGGAAECLRLSAAVTSRGKQSVNTLLCFSLESPPTARTLPWLGCMQWSGLSLSLSLAFLCIMTLGFHYTLSMKKREKNTPLQYRHDAARGERPPCTRRHINKACRLRRAVQHRVGPFRARMPRSRDLSSRMH